MVNGLALKNVIGPVCVLLIFFYVGREIKSESKQVDLSKSAGSCLNQDQVLVIKEFGALSLIERENFEFNSSNTPCILANRETETNTEEVKPVVELNSLEPKTGKLLNFDILRLTLANAYE